MADIKNIDVYQTVSSVSFEVEPITNIVNINKITIEGTGGGSQNLQQVTDIGATTDNTITLNPTVNTNGLNINTTFNQNISGVSTAVNINQTGEGNGIYINTPNGQALEILGSGNGTGIIINDEDVGIYLNPNSTGLAISDCTAESINIINTSGTGVRVFQSIESAIELNLGTNANGIIIESGTSSTGIPFQVSKNSVTKASINQAGELTASKLIKSGGTSSQFLMADGSTSVATSGVTNLTTSQTSTNFTINSDTGTDATIPLGNGSLAGATINDYTNAEKSKLAGIATGAEVNVNADWNATSGDAQILNKPTIPSAITQTSQLTNNGADGVNPFITALDIPTAGQAGTLVREVKNMTGATLVKGTVVYISGANGNKPIVSKALATTDALSARTFGLLQSDILNNGLGNCVIIGDLVGLNTSTFTEGVQLYLSGVTAGTYTSTKTLAPTHLVYVGKVTRSHPTLGQIEVGIQNGYELEEIHDVAISGLANEDFLQYELSTDLWKNKPITDTLIKSKLGITTLSGSNTGDNATNTQYSGLAASKQDTLQNTVNIKSINGNSLLGAGNLTISATTPSQSAFTVLANNTNASAVPTEQVFQNVAEQTNLATASTISWNGTAPTNPISLNYKWEQIGSLVIVRFNLVYTTAGATNAQLIITLPTDMPTPVAVTGFTSANDVICYGSGSFSSSRALPTVIGITALRRNSTNNGYEFIMTRTSGNINTAWLIFQYFA